MQKKIKRKLKIEKIYWIIQATSKSEEDTLPTEHILWYLMLQILWKTNSTLKIPTLKLLLLWCFKKKWWAAVLGALHFMLNKVILLSVFSFWSPLFERRLFCLCSESDIMETSAMPEHYLLDNSTTNKEINNTVEVR